MLVFLWSRRDNSILSDILSSCFKVLLKFRKWGSSPSVQYSVAAGTILRNAIGLSMAEFWKGLNSPVHLVVFMNSFSTCLHSVNSPSTPWSAPACPINPVWMLAKSEWEETLLILFPNKDNKSQSNLTGQPSLILAMGTSPHLGYTVFFPGGSSPTSKDSYTSLTVMHD